MKALIFFFFLATYHLSNAQNVGIGTLSPLSTLHVKGNLRIGGNSSNMRFDSLSGKIEWVNSNLFVPVTQALMKHSAAGDGLFYNNSGGVNGQLEYRNALGQPVFYTNFINSKGYFRGRLGIATIDPLAGLHVADSSVLFSASDNIPGIPGILPLEGPGRRMLWIPDKAAFRVGYVDGDQWNQGNIGNYSFAAGHSTYASGEYSTAFGSGSFAGGTVSTAIGNSALASGNYSTAIGTNAIAGGNFSTALGYNTYASGIGSITMGAATTASGTYSTASGRLTQAIGYLSTAMGDSCIAIGNSSLAMGYRTLANGDYSVATGWETASNGFLSTAMGNFSTANGYLATTMGNGTIANGFTSVAIGHNTTAKALASLSIGMFNDDTDNPDEFTPENEDRLFQIGNGFSIFGFTSRSNAFTVLRNGNIGIGFATPTFPLSFAPVIGDKISLWSNSSNSYGFGISSALLQIHSDVSGSDVAFGYGSSDSFFERMRIINYGGTGMIAKGRIELKNGTEPLHLDYGPGIWLYKSDNSAYLGFMGTQNNQNIGFYGGPVGWGMTYDAINSRVGIGTSTPEYPLHVTGSANRAGNFINALTVFNGEGVYGSCNNTPGQGTGVYAIGGRAGLYGTAVSAGSGYRYGLFAQGHNGTLDNYGVLATAIGGANAYGVYASASGSANNWAGYFNGEVFATFYQGSDRKLKKDIQPLTGALFIINQLKPSHYTYKTDDFKHMNLPEGVHYGLIADEVQQVIPGAVKKAVQPAHYENHDELTGRKLSDEVEFNTVNYTEMIPILIGAIKEQQVMIEELRFSSQPSDQQQQIDALTSLVKSQQVQINELKMMIREMASRK